MMKLDFGDCASWLRDCGLYIVENFLPKKQLLRIDSYEISHQQKAAWTNETSAFESCFGRWRTGARVLYYFKLAIKFSMLLWLNECTSICHRNERKADEKCNPTVNQLDCRPKWGEMVDWARSPRATQTGRLEKVPLSCLHLHSKISPTTLHKRICLRRTPKVLWSELNETAWHDVRDILFVADLEVLVRQIKNQRGALPALHWFEIWLTNTSTTTSPIVDRHVLGLRCIAFLWIRPTNISHVAAAAVPW